MSQTFITYRKREGLLGIKFPLSPRIEWYVVKPRTKLSVLLRGDELGKILQFPPLPPFPTTKPK